MSLEYAVRESDGKRVLIAIKCDVCGIMREPGPDIAMSGWVKRGQDNGPGTDKFEWHYCPDCEGKLK